MNTHSIHPSWKPLVTKALACMDPVYLEDLRTDPDWLPGSGSALNAFSLPLDHTKTILFGESPYPRADSANGYAFWDAAVTSIWNQTGLAKPVNRATSLRNFIKMLLIARGDLTQSDASQAQIAQINKQPLVETLSALFKNLLQQGFLLLNTSLVFYPKQTIQPHVKAWQPFVKCLLAQLAEKTPHVTLLLLGKMAEKIPTPQRNPFPTLVAEHPYNLSFITNRDILNFFRPFDLLKKY